MASLRAIWRNTMNQVGINQIIPPSIKETLAYQEIKSAVKIYCQACVALGATITLTGVVYDINCEKSIPEPPGKLIEIQSGDQTVKVHCQIMGNGKTTVLMDGSQSEASFDWSKVQPEVAKFATVISVDRPGFGYSQPGVLPRTGEQISKELGEILKKLNVHGKVVLVAHGSAGYQIRHLGESIAKGTYSQLELGGVVLVDATEEHTEIAQQSIAPCIKTIQSDNYDFVKNMAKLSQYHLRFYDEHFFSSDAIEHVASRYPAQQQRMAILNELEMLPQTEEHCRNHSWQLPQNFPLVVISHGKSAYADLPYLKRDLTAEMAKEMNLVWQEGQERLVALSTNSTQMIVQGISRLIPQMKPRVVVEGIQAVVNESEGCQSGGIDSIRQGSCQLLLQKDADFKEYKFRG